MATAANPSAGLHGLFYYYHTMAKALAVYGEPTIRDAAGVEHDWARDLSGHLIEKQQRIIAPTKLKGSTLDPSKLRHVVKVFAGACGFRVSFRGTA